MYPEHFENCLPFLQANRCFPATPRASFSIVDRSSAPPINARERQDDLPLFERGTLLDEAFDPVQRFFFGAKKARILDHVSRKRIVPPPSERKIGEIHSLVEFPYPGSSSLFFPIECFVDSI